MSDGRPGWILPAVVTFLVAALGIATNLATDLKSSWVAWAGVAVLTLCVMTVTAVSERRKQGSRSERSVTANTTAQGQVSRSHGLQMRRVRTSNPDGSITVVEEIFSEELARQSLRDDGGEEK